jgi:EAL and modified HD-GYP domain-containing signal transduction protein
MSEIFIGRQPIFDQSLNVIAYEILYRRGDEGQANFYDSDSATTEVLINLFSEFGLEKIAGAHPAYINLSPRFLYDRCPLPFPPGRIVLEIPENLPIDRALVEAVKVLSDSGHCIALDDIADPGRVKPLLSYADVVKVDLITSDRNRLCENVSLLKQYNVKLLAEKVETHEEYRLCKQLGFDYFQGYFLCRPKTIQGKQISPAGIVVLQLLNQFQDPDVDFSRLEQIISQDVLLGYKLLQLINSAHYGMPRKIESIRQAISLLGLEQLRGWLTLFLFTKTWGKPQELTILAMMRAKLCELLARAHGESRPEKYFMIGLFSVLDALLDAPMEKVLLHLPLAAEASDALLFRSGTLGSFLQCVIAHERGQWDIVKSIFPYPEALRKLYLEALDWVICFSAVFS